MNKVRALFLGAFAALMAASADAQPPGASGMTGAQSATVAPQLGAPRSATPLFNIGNLPVGIWTRVPPPYDATANRSAAANPLP